MREVTPFTPGVSKAGQGTQEDLVGVVIPAKGDIQGVDIQGVDFQGVVSREDQFNSRDNSQGVEEASPVNSRDNSQGVREASPVNLVDQEEAILPEQVASQEQASLQEVAFLQEQVASLQEQVASQVLGITRREVVIQVAGSKVDHSKEDLRVARDQDTQENTRQDTQDYIPNIK